METEYEARDVDHLKCSSDSELTFSDWHFVERTAEQGSDDDSVEVIEREILASVSSDGES